MVEAGDKRPSLLLTMEIHSLRPSVKIMIELERIFKDAEAALSEASHGEKVTRLGGMTKFMDAIKDIAIMVAAGSVVWDQVKPWAKNHAHQAVAARRGFEDWSGETYRIYHGGGEEEAERALERRSLLEFALDLLRGTQAEELLDGLETQDVDQDYRAQAEQLGLDLPRVGAAQPHVVVLASKVVAQSTIGGSSDACLRAFYYPLALFA